MPCRSCVDELPWMLQLISNRSPLVFVLVMLLPLPHRPGLHVSFNRKVCSRGWRQCWPARPGRAGTGIQLRKASLSHASESKPSRFPRVCLHDIHSPLPHRPWPSSRYAARFVLRRIDSTHGRQLVSASSHRLLLRSSPPHGVYVLTTWGIVVISAINHDLFLCVMSCKFPLCAPRRQAHESKQLKSRPLARQHDRPLKRHRASSYGHEGFSTPGSRALAVATGLKRPRPSTIPRHPLFCSPAPANGRWGRVSRKEVAGPYILICYYSRVAPSGLPRGSCSVDVFGNSGGPHS